MLDFHSHFLPHLDDGSKSAEESLEMLRESFKQGVTEIIATPHFLASYHTPQTWLEKRNKVFADLKPYLTTEMPKLRLGAEVRYYEGMARSEKLLKLCIEGTNLLLIEMPRMQWTSRMRSVITELSCCRGFTVVLAHIERYFPFQSAEMWDSFRESGILMQANAEFFFERRTRKKALQMLKKGEIDLLGSDCHNMTDRIPCLGAAAEVIGKAFGNDFLNSFLAAEAETLQKAEQESLS